MRSAARLLTAAAMALLPVAASAQEAAAPGQDAQDVNAEFSARNAGLEDLFIEITGGRVQ